MQQPPNQQPPYFQQPQQPYPQSSMQPYPPQARAPRKSRRWPWIVALIVVAIIFYSAGRASAPDSAKNASTASTGGLSSSQQPTTSQKPTTPPQRSLTWKTTHSFTGNGSKKTEAFTVGNDWKINWTCQGANGIDAPLFLTVYTVDGNKPLDLGIQTTCKATDAKTTGGTEEHEGGNVYLDVNAGIEWTIEVQELK